MAIGLLHHRIRRVGSWATCTSIVMADVVALSLVYWIAVLARYLLAPNYALGFYLQLYPVISLFLLAFLLQGLYPGILVHPAEEIRRVSYGVTTVFLLIAAATFLTRDAVSYSRSVFILTWSVGIPAILLARTVTRRTLCQRAWWGVPARLLCWAIGSGGPPRRIPVEQTRTGTSCCGNPDSGRYRGHALGRHFGSRASLESAPEFAAAGAATYAIVAVPEISTAASKAVIQQNCRGFRHILLIPDLPYACSLGVTALDVGGELGIEVPQRLFHRAAGLTKRTLDLLASALGLLVLAPLFALIAGLVKATSRGSVFYGHTRYGLGGTAVFRTLEIPHHGSRRRKGVEPIFRKNIPTSAPCVGIRAQTGSGTRGSPA